MYLQNEATIQVVGIAVQAKGLVVQLEASAADVLLLDWDLRGASMPELIADIRQLETPPKIVVLATQPDVEVEAQGAGADTFFSKHNAPGELLEILRTYRKAN